MKSLFIVFFSIIFAICLNANTLEEIQKSGEIRIGVRLNYPPFSKFDGDDFSGFEVELAKAIAKIIAPKAQIKLVGVNAKDRIPFLNDNKIDMAVAQFAVSPKRQKHVDFSIPYFALYIALVANKTDQIKKLSQVSGKKVLAVPGTGSRSYVEKNVNAQIVDCENMMACFTKLQNNEAIGYFHSIFAVAAIPIMDNKFEIAIKAVGPADFIAVGVNKGNAELRKAIDNAIIQLSKEGFFKEAYEKTLNAYYKGTLDKKLFLLDDLYNFFSEDN